MARSSTDTFPRPELPSGFDRSRARERAAEPEGWRLSETARAGLWEAIEGRCDIRRFRPDPVPDAALETLLEAAHRAPSVGYMQPWRFVVARSQERRLAVHALADRERLRQAGRFGERASHFLEQKIEGIREAPIGLVVCCDHGDPDEEVLGRGTIPETDVYSTSCAIQNLWLAARAEGLGVGWVSFYRPPELARVFDLPDRVEPIAYLCVGYPDERPVRPGLESAGWAARAALATLVHEERWGGPEPRAASGEPAPSTRSTQRPGAAPARERAPARLDRAPAPDRARAAAPERFSASGSSALSDLIADVPPADHRAAIRTRDHADELVKPPGSLGALERELERWAAAAGEVPAVPLRAGILICCGDHGVARRGTSLWGAEVSGQVAAAAARGETAIGVLARTGGHSLVVADVGLSGETPPGVRAARVADGAADITEEPALTPKEFDAATTAGAELAGELLDTGVDCLVAGEVGIGNTTASAAVAGALLGLPADRVVGRGTGLDAARLAAKRRLVAAALERHAEAVDDPAEALRRLGGAELAALAGAMLASAGRRRPIVLDGFATGVVALAVTRACPAARDHLFAAHRSAEVAHAPVLGELGLEPLLDLRLRLGEGSGAALALPLLEQAARLHREMGTFDSARVDGPAAA